MANQEQINLLLKSAAAKDNMQEWNQWHESYQGITLDLTGVNLSYANLSFAECNEVILRGANLTGADFTKANLTNANLHHADLNNINFSQTNLTNVFGIFLFTPSSSPQWPEIDSNRLSDLLLIARNPAVPPSELVKLAWT